MGGTISTSGVALAASPALFVGCGVVQSVVSVGASYAISKTLGAEDVAGTAVGNLGKFCTAAKFAAKGLVPVAGCVAGVSVVSAGTSALVSSVSRR